MTDTVKIEDKHGFIHDVKFFHATELGFSIAYYNDTPIASRDYGKLFCPMGDDDREWEMYQEQLENWKADAETDLKPECLTYINNL